MAAYNLNVDQVLAVLKQNPSFNQLPQDWQLKLAGQVHDGGIESAIGMNTGWLQGNRNNPVSAALGSWLQQAPQAQNLLTNPPASIVQPETPATPDLPQDQFDALVAAANAGDASAISQLEAAGYELAADTEDLPLEQGILQTALPGLLGDIEGDAERRALADVLSGQATDDYNAARDALSPEENARRLAEEYTMADTTAGALSQSAATASAEQLAALQASIEAMKGNLNADLAARAQALQDQIATLTANLGTLDATQKAALAEQIAANQASLQQSITDQWVALNDEVTTLRGAADSNSVARRAALQAEIDGLTAAQAPMAQARLDSANALTTAVNLGLESTNDRLTAERARQGYLGSSSFSDANLARAAIGARQQGAQAMGSARELNAADTRSIAGRGATEGRVLSDELANNYLTLAGRQATGIRSLADTLAEGKRGISDTGAAGNAAIKNSTAQGLFGINNAGANQTYADTTGGSSQLRSLLDSLAQGQGTIAGNLATTQQGARDSGTMAKQGYFDNAYTRGQGAILSKPGLTSQLTGTLTDLGNYGTTGLNRSLGSLGWWTTNQGTAATPGYTPVQADTSGNDIAGLGAGLLSAGMSLGNSKNWWQAPKTTTTTPSTQGTYRDSPYW